MNNISNNYETNKIITNSMNNISNNTNQIITNSIQIITNSMNNISNNYETNQAPALNISENFQFIFADDVKTTSSGLVKQIDINDIYNLITSQNVNPAFERLSKRMVNVIESIRVPNLSKEIQNRLKLHLPVIYTGAWEGKREINNCKEYGGAVILDFDNLNNSENVSWLKDKILNSEFKDSILLMFTSPSGTGLKVILKTNLTIETFRRGITPLLDYVESTIGVEVDKKCKDILRACFLSIDTEAYFNPGATAYIVNTREIIDNNKSIKRENPGKTAFVKGNYSGSKVEIAYQETVQKHTFSPGSRHNFVISFAGYCFHRGVTLEEALQFAWDNFRQYDDFDFERDIAYHIADIYRKNFEQFGDLSSLKFIQENIIGENYQIFEANKYITETEEAAEQFYQNIFLGEEKRVLLNAPTGAGKTQALKAGALRAIQENRFSRIVVIAPNVYIGEQIALELGVTPINHNASQNDRRRAMDERIIVSTYNQIPTILGKFAAQGIDLSSVMIIADEAHSFIEEFRPLVMDATYHAIKNVGKIIYATATPPKGFMEMLDIEKKFYFDIKQRISKYLFLHRSNDINVLAFKIKKYLEQNPGKILPVFINSGSKIEKLKNLFTFNILSDEEVGIIASEHLLDEYLLNKFDIGESIKSTGMIPEGVRVVFMTSCAEYGVNILNENIDTFFYWNPLLVVPKPSSIAQAAARFRKVERLRVDLFISKSIEPANNQYSFEQVFAKTQKILSVVLEDLNETFLRQKQAIKNKNPFRGFESIEKDQNFFFPNKTTKLFTPCEDGKGYRLCYFATLTETHNKYYKYIGYRGVINELVEEVDNTFSFDKDSIIEYDVKKKRTPGKCIVIEKSCGVEPNSSVFSNDKLESELLTKEEALALIYQAYLEYQAGEDKNSLPFSFVLICVGILYYKFDFREEQLTIDGVHCEVMRGIPRHPAINNLATRLKELGFVFERAGGNRLLIKLIQLLRRGFSENLALRLALALTYSKTALETFNFLYNNTVFDNSSYDSEKCDVLHMRYIENTRIPAAILEQIIKEIEASGEQGWEIRRITDRINRGKTLGQRLVNNSKTVIRHLNILTKTKTIRKKNKAGKFYSIYKIVSVKPVEEQWEPVIKAIFDLTGTEIEASTIIQAINSILNSANTPVEYNEFDFDFDANIFNSALGGSKLINQDSLGEILEQNLKTPGELTEYIHYDNWQTVDAEACDYVPF
jgi:late competence protein required for DNA uptake (superfamily II DNA/RNA helicase)